MKLKDLTTLDKCNNIDVMIEYSDKCVSNRFLLLYLAYAMKRKQCKLDKLKLMKIPYFVNLDSIESGCPCFMYKFYKYTYGPFNEEIYTDTTDNKERSLSYSGLIDYSDIIDITEKGKDVVHRFLNVFDNKNNSYAKELIDKYVSDIGCDSFEEIKNKVYKRAIPSYLNTNHILLKDFSLKETIIDERFLIDKLLHIENDEIQAQLALELLSSQEETKRMRQIAHYSTLEELQRATV